MKLTSKNDKILIFLLIFDDFLKVISTDSTQTFCDCLNMAVFPRRQTISSSAIMSTAASSRWRQYACCSRTRSNTRRISSCCAVITNARRLTASMVSTTNASGVLISSCGRRSRIASTACRSPPLSTRRFSAATAG